MRIEIKEKQTVDVIIKSYDICDKCEAKIETTWDDAFECTFEHRTGYRCSGGGSGEIKTIELCQNCTIAAFLLLEQNGYKAHNSEWDY
ncbi:hypothetical protein LCGC14_0903670 [marine sediment metagenome]|uniref:Uncharacterized protein n=1 Tax=marine sediment metagenome TaxID=412755 RepID=A0A0F9PGC7_9ZZZZ